MKETEEDTNKWKDIPCSCIRRDNIVKVSIIPKAIKKIQCNLSQNSNGIYQEIEKKKNPKICVKTIQDHKWLKQLRKYKTGGITLPGFQAITQRYSIKTLWYWHKTNMEINRTEPRTHK